MPYTLSPLPYEYDALEPFIDAQTMTIHHDKHHQAYVNNLNKALEKFPEWQSRTPEELLADLNVVPEEIRAAVRNNGGGVVNHNFFWQILAKDKAISGEIQKAVDETFGSFEIFQEQFSKAAAGQFGSGWAWLVSNNGKLEIMATANQDSPLSVGKKPLLAIDVWEHAYYLKYQNRRPEYIAAFFNVINWEKVNELLQ
jgi:Fe-Mn family superoxide dismutase